MKYYQEEILNNLTVGCQLKWGGYISEVEYFEIIEIHSIHSEIHSIHSGDDILFDVEVGEDRCKSIWSLKMIKRHIYLYRKV